MSQIISHSKPWISREDITAVKNILAGGMINRGETAEKFERELSAFLEVRRLMTVPSCATAIRLCLKTLELSRKDEVVLPTYVCNDVLNAVYSAGGTPVLCDVGRDWVISPGTVEPCISRKTKAIILVHMFGIACNPEPFKRFRIPLIEDCAQAFGLKINGETAGSIGDFGVFSFNATKCLTTGEGGAVTTKNNRFFAKLSSERFSVSLSDLQASLGLSQLKRCREMLRRRKRMAELYFKELSGLKIELPNEIGEKSIFFRFPVRIEDDFEKVRKKFERKGIMVRRGVDTLLHRKLGLPDKNFSMSEYLFKTTLSLPLYPSLKSSEMRRVISAAREIFS